MPTMTHALAEKIPGHGCGKGGTARSPISIQELREIEQTLGWTDYDAQTLQRDGQIFEDHAEEMVDAWRQVIASQPHLAKWFAGASGKPDDDYKASVKKRFVQWVKDACFRPHDQEWLDYQEEIGLRSEEHTSE